MGEPYYDPSIGRFTQLDPLGNGYVYAGDNPINFADPSGLAENRPFLNVGPPSPGIEPGSDEPAVTPEEAATTRLAEELRPTDTVERNMEKRGITRRMIAKTILRGERSPDTGGARGGPREGAYDYRYRMEIRGKWRYVKVVYSPSDHRVWHVHYQTKPIR